MVEITFATNWDTEGQSNFGNQTHVNHESKLSEEDMKALVMEILDLPGMRDVSGLNLSDEILKTRLTRLSNALQDKGGTDKIFVNKGIHQRNECPHFTMNVSPIGPGEGNFEIFVQPDRQITRRNKRFYWEVWAISFSNRRMIYHYPTDTDGRRTNVWSGHNPLVRSNSISNIPRVGNIVSN